MQEMNVTELLLLLVSCLVTVLKIYRIMRQRHLSSFLLFLFVFGGKKKKLFRLDTKLQFSKINEHS